MATTKKRTTRKINRKKVTRKPARKTTTRRKTTTSGRKPIRRNAAKKALSWGKDVKAHPVTGKPCAGRPMSQRDQKLFTKMGKRRAGVTPTMVKEAYGKKTLKKRAAPKKRKTTTRKAPSARKRTTAKRKAPARRTGRKVTVSGLPVRPQKYVIVDGRLRYQSSHRLLTTARKAQTALESANPRKKFRIVKLEG